MRKAAVFLGLFLSGLFLFTLPACQRDAQYTASISEARPASAPDARLAGYVRDLTAGTLEGRRTGERGEARAALYLARFMRQQGLLPAGTSGTFFQVFPLAGYEPVLSENRMTFRNTGGAGGKTGENLLGYIAGSGQAAGDEKVILICAHYDHLGLIEKRLYAGANDNASGVAAVMELINGFSKTKPRTGILFAFFSGEEMGLLGSAYFAEHPTVPLTNIACVINLDSLGLLREDKALMGWAGPENETSRGIVAALERAGWNIKWEKTDKHTSDHLPFAKKNIAGFTLLSPAWLEQNHTRDDTTARLKMIPLASFLQDLTEALDETLRISP